MVNFLRILQLGIILISCALVGAMAGIGGGMFTAALMVVMILTATISLIALQLVMDSKTEKGTN